MTDQAGNSSTKSSHYCRRCGHELRPGAQFCTKCGHVTAPSGEPANTTGPFAATGYSGPPQHPASREQPSQGQSRENPTQDPPGPHSPRRRPGLAWALTGAGVLAVAGLAAVIVLLAHPFGHQAAGSSPPSSLRARTAASRVPASPSAGSSALAGASVPGASPSAGSPSPASTQQAAAALAALLASSAADRQAVDSAFNDVQQCGPDLAQDATAFQTAATSHQSLLSQLAQLPGRPALPQPMLADLTKAWQASASADEDFARWAQDQAGGGCSAGNQSDPNFLAADGPDLRATSGKTAFVRLWNPLAQAYGLPTYQQDGF
jgi:hypothetical protein